MSLPVGHTYWSMRDLGFALKYSKYHPSLRLRWGNRRNKVSEVLITVDTGNSLY